MVNVTVDDELRAKLGELRSPVTQQDASGRGLAYVTPAVDRSIYDELDPGIGDEEIERRSAAGGGIPLAEILADFQQRLKAEGE